jgi:hypothetical protein
VRILVVVKLLKPLGNPPANSDKFFAMVELLKLVRDQAWLARVTNCAETALAVEECGEAETPAARKETASALVSSIGQLGYN